MSDAKKKETFILKVEYFQNETWQGQMIWAEENRSIRFRSALELMRLMDEALTSDQAITVEREQSVS